jgi:hypothetical protein
MTFLETTALIGWFRPAGGTSWAVLVGIDPGAEAADTTVDRGLVGVAGSVTP